LGTAVGTPTGKSGKISIQIPYSLGSDCSFHGGSVLITVHPTDKTNQKASAATFIKSCQIIWTACGRGPNPRTVNILGPRNIPRSTTLSWEPTHPVRAETGTNGGSGQPLSAICGKQNSRQVCRLCTNT